MSDEQSRRLRELILLVTFAEGNHEVRDGDFVKFRDGHAANVRINGHDQKWTYVDRNGHCVEPFAVPPEDGIERLYTIQEVGEILAQGARVQTRIGP